MPPLSVDQHNVGVSSRWGRRNRERVVRRLLRNALLEIRMFAARPDDTDDPFGRIHMIADVCHNLPGAVSARSDDGFDPFVYIWQTAKDRQRRWLTAQFNALGVDYRYLIEAPRWPPPATAPDMRPRMRRHGWRLPRDPGAFVSLDTTTLQTLVHAAEAFERPGATRPDWLLAHLDPHGPHILWPSRTGEPLFQQQGPDDLRQYRGLLRMADGALVVGHLRLRESTIATRPANLSIPRRWLLAATPSRARERDVYLWGRDHHATAPNCPQCTPSTGAS